MKNKYTQIDAMRSVRKQMPRPTETHGRIKYKRNKDWKREQYD